MALMLSNGEEVNYFLKFGIMIKLMEESQIKALMENIKSCLKTNL